MVVSLGQPIRGMVSYWLMFPIDICFQNTCTWSGSKDETEEVKKEIANNNEEINEEIVETEEIWGIIQTE